MIVAIPAIAKVAAKILSMLLGDKKGQKFLGYVVGIALFIVLIPIIAVYGLFGWMTGSGAEAIFTTNGISKAETNKAKLMYLSFLTDYASRAVAVYMYLFHRNCRKIFWV